MPAASCKRDRVEYVTERRGVDTPGRGVVAWSNLDASVSTLSCPRRGIVGRSALPFALLCPCGIAECVEPFPASR